MLAQDPVTGYLHEVPDAYFGYDEYPEFVGEAPVVYEGLGAPLGLPFLAPIAAAAAPLIAKAAGALAPIVSQAAGRILPQAGQLVSSLLPQAQQLIGQLAPGGAPAPGGALPPLPGLPPLPNLPALLGPRPFFRAPAPVGWVTPALPFTGRQPRRLYMRCSVWPGGAGLVPVSATQPVPTVPAVPVPGVAVPGVVRRRRRRR
jgi:hypothetical protein